MKKAKESESEQLKWQHAAAAALARAASCGFSFGKRVLGEVRGIAPSYSACELVIRLNARIPFYFC